MLDRKLFTHDLSAKLLSLVAAILVWSTIKFAVITDEPHDLRPFASQNPLPALTRQFTDMPITVLTTAEDLRGFKVYPSTVTATVSGEARILNRLTKADIHVFVNLRDVTESRDLRKAIQIYLPPGLKVEEMVPSDVRVERVEPPSPPGFN